MREQIEREELGIVIGSLPFGDRDMIFRVLLEKSGKTGLLAKNMRGGSKRLGNIDIFDHGIFRFASGKGSLLLLKSVCSHGGFHALRTNLVGLATASILCESFDFLLPDIETSESSTLYRLLRDSLAEICEAKLDVDVFRACYRGLGSVLTETGFADPISFATWSVPAFLNVLNQIELIAERQLRSRPTLESLMRH